MRVLMPQVLRLVLLFHTMFAMSSLAFAVNDKTDTKNAKLETVTGIVSDAKCGAASHDADCVKKCEKPANRCAEMIYSASKTTASQYAIPYGAR